MQLLVAGLIVGIIIFIICLVDTADPNGKLFQVEKHEDDDPWWGDF